MRLALRAAKVGGLGSMPCTHISMALSLAHNLCACQAPFSFICLPLYCATILFHDNAITFACSVFAVITCFITLGNSKLFACYLL